MHRIFRVKAYEAEHGPHFNEEHARKAVSKMENEDGTRGPHWSVEETTALASQYGINLGSRFNRYDWFVALNMVYSDYYKVIISMTNSNSTKHFVELAKAWINDKDIDEGKMWYYYIYVMCDKIRQAEMECYEEEVEKRDKYEDDDDDEFERIGLFRRGGRRGGMMRGGRRVYSTSRARDYEDDYERMLEREKEYEPYNASKFNIVGAKIDAQTQIINDKFCQLEMREMQNKIDVLRDEKQALQLSASQQAQTANIVNQIRPCPVPAYLTCNPFGCQGGLNDYGYGYGYGYNNGCGCGC